MAPLLGHEPDDIDQPPAKKARLDPPVNAFARAPDTAFEDSDDEDLYADDVGTTTPVKNETKLYIDSSSQPARTPAPPSTTFSIPGLGLSPSYPKKPQHLQHKGDAEIAEEPGSTGVGEASAQPSVGQAASPSAHIKARSLPSPAGSSVNDPARATSSASSPGVISIPGLGLSSAAGDVWQTSTDNQAEPFKAGTRPSQDTKNGFNQVPVESTHLDAKVDAGFLEAAHSNKNDKDAEWQYDSSDAEPGSSDTSSDSSDDSDSEAEGDYPLLDPAEQARILMRGDADGEGGGPSGQLRSANERAEQYSLPEVHLPEDARIVELGQVESIVDVIVVIKSTVSMREKALDQGSVLFLSDRSVLGAVAEPFFKPEDPRYAVGFPTPSHIPTTVFKGTKVYYADVQDERITKYVFNQNLRNMKYSDASNIHDEEGGDVEFSDDEAEAEYKRNMKQAKAAGRQNRRDQASGSSAPTNQQKYRGALNYDDDGADDEGEQ